MTDKRQHDETVRRCPYGTYVHNKYVAKDVVWCMCERCVSDWRMALIDKALRRGNRYV